MQFLYNSIFLELALFLKAVIAIQTLENVKISSQ